MRWEEDREWVLGTLQRMEAKMDKLTEGHWKLYAKVVGISAVVGIITGVALKAVAG